MALDADVFEHLTKASPQDAWRTIVNKALEITARPITSNNHASEVTRRDREIGTLDHFLSSSGWDLWQDLEGFRLDDYKPFSDVSDSMDRLVNFLSLSLVDRQRKIVKLDDESFEIVSSDGTDKRRFTLNRDVATSRDDIELMGLDHPLVQEELGRWRGVAPESLGLSVKADIGEPALLSLWLVEVSAANRDRRVTIQPIAVKTDGTRLPAIERQCDRYFSLPTSAPFFSPKQRVDLFSRFVEPTLQRELNHKGTGSGDGSYSAELVGYVEIC